MPIITKQSKEVLYPFRYGLAFSFFEGITWMIASATPMVLLLQKLGGGTLAVGLSFSFAYLMLPIQVISTTYLRILGYKSQVLLSLWARTFFLSIPLMLTLIAPEPSSSMVILMVTSFFFMSLFRATGHAALFPWLYHLLPIRLRGRYFAFDQKYMNYAAMLVLISSSLFFYCLKLYQAFFAIYSCALIGSIGGIYSLSKLKNVPNPETLQSSQLWAKTKQICLTPGPSDTTWSSIPSGLLQALPFSHSLYTTSIAM